MVVFIAFVLLMGSVLLVEEIAYRETNLPGEYLRKFVHMSAGTILAFSPWFLSWSQIRLIAALMVLLSLINIRLRTFRHLSLLRRGHGDLYLALGTLASAWLTTNKIFFCLAVLNVALADGMAAVIGNWLGGNWQYKVFGQTKTVIGTMAFWLVSMMIFGIGLLFANNEISPTHYLLLLVLAPPLLALVENLAVFGFDNLLIPLVVLLALHVSG